MAHGLPVDGGESNPWFRVRVGPLTIPLPNPPSRRRAVFFHDVNHILAGYNTVFSDGEMVIAGFEVGNGCGRFGIAWFINLCMMAFGMLVRPRAVFHAFVRGRGCSSMYHRQEARSDLQALTVGGLRTTLGFDRPIPEPGARDRLRFLAWAFLSWVVTLVPAAAALAFIWAVVVIVRSVVD